MGAPQLQNQCINGFTPETIPAGAPFTDLLAPAVADMGYLELVPDQTILSMADPYDIDGDGISGVPDWNLIPSYITPLNGAVEQQGKYICRIGKKASVYNIFEQVCRALNQDIGIVSEFEPIDTYTHQSVTAEISNEDIQKLVFYLQTIKTPTQRNPDDAEVKRGKELFTGIGCTGCHKETLTTGYSSCESLSFQNFHPYTDLLLHDMGSGLDDGYTEGNAKTYEWRTPPLWGLGLAPLSQDGAYYLLHDGRAHSIQEAIEMHGGEATARKNSFDHLTDENQKAIIKFLESL